MMSASGGMDIEEVARQTPEKIIRYSINPFIGLPDYLARRFAFALFPQMEQAGKMAAILQELYRIFVENDASLVEVNPLALTKKGTLMAIDAKIVFDDNGSIVIRRFMLCLIRRKKKKWKQMPKIKDSVMFTWTAISVVW